jgi:hypothetical protein
MLRRESVIRLGADVPACGVAVRAGRCPSGRPVIRLLLVSALRRWSAPVEETVPQGTDRRP